MLPCPGNVCFPWRMSENKTGAKAPPRRIRPATVLAGVLLVFAIAAGWRWWLVAPDAPPPAAPAAASPQPAPDASRVLGRWQRPDGGYVLEITGWKAGGRLEARYFNPRPIHVGQAAWTQTRDGLGVFVELRDEGYPGATYALRLDTARDQLVGAYHQPAAGQTFEVAFVRLPPSP